MVKPQNRSTTDAHLDRRRFLQGALSLTAAASTPGVFATAAEPAAREGPAVQLRRPRLRVAVVGAGAFGGWTALHLARRGAEVTLVDAWGAGNPRSSSGGETRVIRGMYGADAVYTDWVVRSFELWREAEWEERLYRRTGVLWMFRGDDAYARDSLPLLEERGLPVDEFEVAAARGRFPQVSFEGVRSVFYEHEAGYLPARHACRRIAEAVSAAGGTVRVAWGEPGAVGEGAMGPLRLVEGSAAAPARPGRPSPGDGEGSGVSTLEADAYVFACGPWLGRLFPEAIGAGVRPTRQEVYFFGVPAGEARYEEERFPTWIDFGERVFYGVPGNLGRGFKVADDTRGEEVDPTTMERTPTAAHLDRARRLLAERFPPLAGAPLVEARVCQYENSPDGDLVLDRLPGAANAWVAGGGSGHGFKLGPAVGEHVARLVLGEAEPFERFSIARLATVLEAPRTQMRGDG